MIEITLDELNKLQKDTYQIFDIRNDESFSYGSLPGAVHLPQNVLEADMEKDMPGVIKNFPEGKTSVLVCQRGQQSREIAERLTDAGAKVQSLKGGFNGWLLSTMQEENDDDEEAKIRREQIEKDFEKKYRHEITTPFSKAINDYDMIQPGDRIAVCISGGKDSFLMAKLFQRLKRHNKIPFELKFICMDPGYSQMNREVIENNAKLLGVPIEIHNSNIFDSVDNVEKSPCYLCARMRRGHLYSMAKAAGCNKIALGHHYDDVIETILMGMLHSGQFQTMMPKINSTNFEGMELIRPLYLIREDDIKKWRDENGLHFIRCACHFTDTCSTFDPESHNNSKRMETKHLIAELKKNNPFVEGNIFRSVENVNLATIVSYKQDGVRHNFTEWYDKKKAEHADAAKAILEGNAGKEDVEE